MRRMTAVVVVLLVVLIGGALPGDRALYPVKAGQPSVPVYIVDNGFHTDLAIPRAMLMRPGAPSTGAVAALPPSPWVLIGWGDSSYYRGSVGVRSRQLDAVRALLRPGNPAVIRIEPLGRAPQEAYETANLTALSLSEPGFDRLVARLDRSFTLSRGAPVRVETRVEDAPEFYYASTEHFGIAKLCTHWTGQLLNAAGVPAHRVVDAWVPGLLLDLKLRAGVTPHRRLQISSPAPAAEADLPAAG
jgi:hypothetical protein